MRLHTYLTLSFFFGIGATILGTAVLLADAQKFVFVSEVQTIEPAKISEQITLQSQDGSGSESKVPSTTCVELRSTSTQGEFSSSATSFVSVSVLTIAKNSANRNFYYKDRTAGTYTLTAKVALKPEAEKRSCADFPVAEWPSGWSATQSITVGSTSTPSASTETASTTSSTTTTTTEEVASTPPPATSAPSGSSATWTYKPQIFVSALAPARGVAGAPVSVSAVAVGVKKEPLLNAHYLWSFGDGGVGEGKQVTHIYHYPAVYTVLVDASSGEWSALDRKEITIVAPELFIADVKEGADGFIALQNNGTSEVDLSLWILRSSSGAFLIPRGTLIGAKKTIPFPSEITKLLADAEGTTLLYPNGNTVVTYTVKQEVLPEVVSVPTPVKREEFVPVVSASDTGSPQKTVLVSASEKVEEEKGTATVLASSSLPAQAGELLGAVGATEK
ncbi:MAG: PKD domain-containing protein, partial [bacterium]|nr:PKD domain-containing protein [bacterium]